MLFLSFSQSLLAAALISPSAHISICLSCLPASSLSRHVTNSTVNSTVASNSTLPLLRILPIGDSITYGYNESPPNSYRRFLACGLSSNGYGSQYVGSQATGDWPNNAHDGYPGRKIAEIQTLAKYQIEAFNKPNVVLLHVGTSDMIQKDDVENAPARLGRLIDYVIEKNPDAVVLVAEIIPINDPTIQLRIDKFNAAILDLVRWRQGAGKKIRSVSMGLVYMRDLPDTIHPDAIGYGKMATAFYSEIVKSVKAGQVVNATGWFWDEGKTAVPASGRCRDLKA